LKLSACRAQAELASLRGKQHHARDADGQTRSADSAAVNAVEIWRENMKTVDINFIAIGALWLVLHAARIGMARRTISRSRRCTPTST